MHGEDHRFVADPVAGVLDPDAEINIFKPDRPEALVEAAEAGPGSAPDQQESTGGLLGIAGLGQIEIQAAVTAIDRIARPDPVQPYVFKGQCRRRGEASQREAALWHAARLAQGAGSNGDQGIVETTDQCRESFCRTASGLSSRTRSDDSNTQKP